MVLLPPVVVVAGRVVVLGPVVVCAPTDPTPNASAIAVAAVANTLAFLNGRRKGRITNSGWRPAGARNLAEVVEVASLFERMRRWLSSLTPSSFRKLSTACGNFE